MSRRIPHIVGTAFSLAVLFGLYHTHSPPVTHLLVAGFVTYVGGTSLVALFRATRHRGKQGTDRGISWCAKCDRYVNPVDYDQIPECAHCGWKPGYPVVRWFWYSVPAVEARYRLNTRSLVRTSVVALVIVGIGLLPLGGLSVLGPEVSPIVGKGADIVDEGAESFDDATSADRSEIRMAIHERINEERTERGLSQLSYTESLGEVAQAHSEDMAEQGYFSHTSPSGTSMRDRYRLHGVSCRVSGENIFRSTLSAWSEDRVAREVVKGWMNSPGHRENILNAPYTRQGIGIAEGENGMYVTQNFC